MTRFLLDSGPGQKIAESRLIAVLVVHQVDDALHIAEALLNGGVNVMELTLRTPVAIDALRAIRKSFPDMTAGIGTILKTEQVDEVLEAGGDFGVSPGFNSGVVRYAQQQGLPFAPGVMTPTDIDQALIEHDCQLLKFFPAGSSGGLPHLKNIAAPYKHLNPKFIPLGGVTPDNLRTYLASDLIAAVGGSWLAPADVIAEKNWTRIEANARHARELANI